MALSAIMPVLLAVSALPPGDSSWPLGDRLVWLPMTGENDKQMVDAAAAGYDTVLWKISPSLSPDTGNVDFAPIDERIERARRHGLQSILAILGEGGLGKGEFFDIDEQGNRMPDQLDPFWPEAVARTEQTYTRVVERYRADPDVPAFLPTWGIYGEAGFKSFAAGRSPHALVRFNEWRRRQGLQALQALPSRKDGPNTEYNRFIRFRYLYMEEQFDGIIRRLKDRSGGKPVGTWQELYPIIGHLYTMVEVPSADLALYESCFPFQTTHHPRKTLSETMGFRYRCDSAEAYRDYYLPLIARKRGEGQRFMGCQLSNDYARRNYAWPAEKADRVRFDEWEDQFAAHLKNLNGLHVESVARDVLLVFPTYTAASLSDPPVHAVDTITIDVLLRMFGCQIIRCASPALDKMSVEELSRFRLIVVPCAAFLLEETLDKLMRCEAVVVFTGCFGQSLSGEYTPFGGQRSIRGLSVRYISRPAGKLTVGSASALTADLGGAAASLPPDESFSYVDAPPTMQVHLRCGEQPLLSTSAQDRQVFIHGHLFAGLAYDPDRKPPTVGGSADASANEVDLWGPYSSAKPENLIGRTLMRNLLDHARVQYRVPDPKPRTFVPYLGDHMEQASVSANIAYNNTDTPQELRVRLPYKPQRWPGKPMQERFEAQIVIRPFGYVVLEPEDTGR